MATETTNDQTTEQSRTRRVMYGLTFRKVEVKRVESLTPRYLRITVGGDQLEGFQSLGAQDHFKLILPAEGQAELVLPEMTPEGPRYPEGAVRPVLRDYTPRFFDPETNELTFEVVLHEQGTVSDWARQAAPGQIVGTAGPRGSHIVEYGTFDWFLAAGDETSIPSIARALEALPAGMKAYVFIEVDGPEDELPLPTQADATISWLHRNGAVAGTSPVLEQAIRAFDFPEGEGFQTYTGEANALRDIRRYLLKEKGLDKQWIDFSGHWKYGTADFDHHAAIED
ncbi:MAG: siderophore-interacting protein [Thermomicrobiales bacterium]